MPDNDQPTAPVVNLNKARKARMVAAARVQADANAVRFGRTKADRDTARLTAARNLQRLAAHERDPG